MTSHLLPVFARIDLAFERGEGCWLVTTNGERYLDFGTGIAVNSLGHSHPHLVEALTEQVGNLWHVSNLYKMPLGESLTAYIRTSEMLHPDGTVGLVADAVAPADAVTLAFEAARQGIPRAKRRRAESGY